MRNFTKKIGFVSIVGLLLIGCQSEQEMKKIDGEKKGVMVQKETKIHVTPEEEKEIHNVIEAFVQTTNEKNSINIWLCFRTK